MNFIEKLTVLLYSQKNLLIAVLIVFILRILFLIFFHNNINAVEDFTIAQNIVNGNGYSLVPQIGPTAIKTPVYPLILSLFVFVFGTFSKIAIVIFQYILASFIPFLMIKLCDSLKLEKAGYIAAWLYLIHPSYFYYPNVIEVTNIFIPLFMIFLILSIRIYYSADIKILLLNGLFSGIIILTQPIITPVVIAIIIFFAIKKKWKKALLSILLIGIVLTPWTIRNYNTFNKIIPTKSPFWMNFYIGYLPPNLVDKKFDVLEKTDQNKIDSLYKIGKNDVQMESYFKEIIEKTISKKPLLYIEKTFYQMLDYWSIPPRYIARNDFAFLIIRKIPVVVFNFLLIISILVLWRKHKNLLSIIIFILLYFTVVYGLTSVANIRFKLDIEWLELIPIALLLTELLNKRKMKEELIEMK